MDEEKGVILGFRTTRGQAHKLATLAGRAGVNMSEVLRRLVDDVEDIHPGNWTIRWAGQEKREAIR